MGARRRAIGGALSNIGQDLFSYALKLRQQEAESNLVKDRQLELSRQNAEQAILDRAKSDPAFAARLQARNPNMVIGGIPISTMVPTADQAAGNIAGKIAGAADPQHVPTDADILGMGLGEPGMNRAGDNPQIAALMQQAKLKRDQQMALLKPETVSGVFNPFTGASETKIIPGAQALGGGSFQTAPTTEQAISIANRTEAGTRPEKVKTQGAEAGAREAASAPYHPELLYNESGDITPFVMGPGGPKQQDMPPGYSKNNPTAGENGNLPQTMVDQVATINTAEVEGVKILAALKQSGLDQSNDPLDPRWQRFLAGTLKVSSDQVNSDIQQRTAFVKAAIIRSLMGGRPSMYVAKMYEQHIPDGAMSGSKLKQVLTNVLQQGSERRGELSNVSGRPLNGPSTGQSFEQWMAGPGKEVVDPVLASGRAKLGGR